MGSVSSRETVSLEGEPWRVKGEGALVGGADVIWAETWRGIDGGGTAAAGSRGAPKMLPDANDEVGGAGDVVLKPKIDGFSVGGGGWGGLGANADVEANADVAAGVGVKVGAKGLREAWGEAAGALDTLLLNDDAAFEPNVAPPNTDELVVRLLNTEGGALVLELKEPEGLVPSPANPDVVKVDEGGSAECPEKALCEVEGADEKLDVSHSVALGARGWVESIDGARTIASSS